MLDGGESDDGDDCFRNDLMELQTGGGGAAGAACEMKRSWLHGCRRRDEIPYLT